MNPDLLEDLVTAACLLQFLPVQYDLEYVVVFTNLMDKLTWPK